MVQFENFSYRANLRQNYTLTILMSDKILGKYFIWSLGCQMNRSDAERLASVLEVLGFLPTDNESEASLIIVMACSVRQSGIDRILGRMRKWESYRKHHSLITILSGCVLPKDKKMFGKKFDILIDSKDIHLLPNLIQDSLSKITETNNEHVVDYLKIAPKYNSTFQAYVPIQTGCNNFCTYCAVPFTRGREVSRPSQYIIKEIDALVHKGYKSITLLGQNVNSYGLDKNGSELNFSQLLSTIENIPGDFWVHFTSPHPKDMKDNVLSVMKKSSKIAHQLHLPLQAGSSAVLKTMNRKYTKEEYIALALHIRKMVPDIAMSTDIIVGFPGETQKQFEETLEVFDTIQFDQAYIARYSQRLGTAASKMFPDDVTPDEKKRRFEALNALLKKYSLAYNKQLVGKTLKVLIESQKDGYYYGLTEGLKKIKIPSNMQDIVGTFQKVRVERADVWNLQGKIVED